MYTSMCSKSASLASVISLALVAVAPLVSAIPPLMRHEIETLPSPQKPQYDRRQESSGMYTAITGISGNGSQTRLEFRDLEKNTDQFNLFVLALARFMNSSEAEKLSYYQIAGIHGRPYVPWDGVGPFVGNVQGPGYCTHVSNIFLPWHRPYLALYEQQLYTHMLDVVDTFQGDQHTRYAQAAATWRHPYWDWATPAAQGQSVYPASFQSKTINVTLPNGTATIANPLFAFEFHPVSVSDFYYNPFATWNETKRDPTGWFEDAVSQNQFVGAVLDNNQGSIQQRIYNLFTNYDNFTEFGNEAWYAGSQMSNADSLESVHDVIHAIIGQSGHMTYLDYSAFDPLFWMHHAMIDRLFALFQALHPDSYVEPMNAIQQTYTIAPHQYVDVNTPLAPFHSDTQGTIYTSETARDWNTFGYTYPELVGNYSMSSVRAAINGLYGKDAGSKVLNTRDVPELTGRDEDLEERGLTVMTLSQLPGETTSEGKRKQYIVNLQSEKFATNGSYAIYVFLGYYNEDLPSSWALAPNLVGTHGVFTALPGDNSASSGLQSRDMPSVLVTGTIPLTGKLLEKVQKHELASMDDSTVENYLANNLHWKAALFDNTEIPIDQIAGLNVDVVRAEVQPATARDQFPQWGNFVQLKKITGRDEGCDA